MIQTQYEILQLTRSHTNEGNMGRNKKLENMFLVFRRSLGILTNKKAANQNRSQNGRNKIVQDNEERAGQNAR